MTPTRPLSFGEFVGITALLFATIAFSVDAMLPALGAIAADLSPEAANRAQLVVGTFLAGMGLGTLFIGPISDALGRRRVIVAGIAVYLLASVVAANAPSLEVLLAARFVQGLGAAAPRIVSVAMVRDLHAGRQMARVMSIIFTIFIIVPAIAPAVGALILWWADWRAIFWAFVAFGLVSGAWFMLRQPETLPPERRRPLRVATLAAATAEVWADRAARKAVVALTLGFGMLICFLTSAPQIYADVYGRGAEFPFWFALVALMSAAASFANSRLVVRLGMRRIALVAYVLQFGAAAAMLAALALPLGNGAEFAVFFGFMGVVFFCNGITFGNINAIALENLGHIAGLAASVVGAAYTVGAVLIALPVGQSYDGSPLPLALAVAGFSAAAFLTVRSLPRDSARANASGAP